MKFLLTKTKERASYKLIFRTNISSYLTNYFTYRKTQVGSQSCKIKQFPNGNLTSVFTAI